MQWQLKAEVAIANSPFAILSPERWRELGSRVASNLGSNSWRVFAKNCWQFSATFSSNYYGDILL
jgi:hypothetical protein